MATTPRAPTEVNPRGGAAATALPSEAADLRGAIISSVGEQWLYARNIWLGGVSPDECMRTGRESDVRDLLRSILASALT